MIQNDDYAILDDYLNQDPELRGLADREAQQRAEKYKRDAREREPTPTEPQKIAQAAAPDAPKLRIASSVEYEPVRYLVYPYIPLGKLTLLQGDSGVGKTALCCKIVATVSLGVPMQDAPCVRGKSLIISVEDDQSTLKGRVDASGGDSDQYYFVDNSFNVEFGNIDTIDSLVASSGARLVVFDPIQAFLGAKIDMNKANEIRPVLAKLSDLAKKRDCAIVMVAHLGKGANDKKAIYRSIGSVDVPAQCRSILQVMRNPSDENQCVMVHVKCSNAPTAKSIAYRIVDKGGVNWEGYSDLTVKDLDKPTEQAPADTVNYDDDPLVMFLQVVVKDNPQPEGVFLGWKTFIRYAETGGFYLGNETKTINKQLQALKSKLAENDDIYFRVTGKGYSDIGQKRDQSHVEYGVQVEPINSMPQRGIMIAKRARAEEVVL